MERQAGDDWQWWGRLDRLIDATERSAKAQEDLIALAKEEREVTVTEESIPHCPNCGAIDPMIVSDTKGEDRISGFALIAECQACGKEFVGLVRGWQLFGSRAEALAFKAGGESVGS